MVEGRVRLSGIPCNRTVSLLSYASGERRACFGGGVPRHKAASPRRSSASPQVC